MSNPNNPHPNPGPSSLQRRLLEAVTTILPPASDAFICYCVPNDITGFDAQLALTGEPGRLVRVLRDFLSMHDGAPSRLQFVGEETTLRPIAEFAAAVQPPEASDVGGEGAEVPELGGVPRIPVPPPPTREQMEAWDKQNVHQPLTPPTPRQRLRHFAEDLKKCAAERVMLGVIPQDCDELGAYLHLLVDVTDKRPSPEMVRRAVDAHRASLMAAPAPTATTTDGEAYVAVERAMLAALEAAFGGAR